MEGFLVFDDYVMHVYYLDMKIGHQFIRTWAVVKLDTVYQGIARSVNFQIYTSSYPVLIKAIQFFKAKGQNFFLCFTVILRYVRVKDHPTVLIVDLKLKKIYTYSTDAIILYFYHQHVLHRLSNYAVLSTLWSPFSLQVRLRKLTNLDPMIIDLFIILSTFIGNYAVKKKFWISLRCVVALYNLLEWQKIC
jgi:hypothetical protein